jgi:hypothetical protein
LNNLKRESCQFGIWANFFDQRWKSEDSRWSRKNGMVMDDGHGQWSNAFFNLTRIFQRTMEGNGTTMAIDQKINQPETISPYTSEPFPL